MTYDTKRDRAARRALAQHNRQLVLQLVDGDGLDFHAAAAEMKKPVQHVASLYCSGKIAAARALAVTESAS
jgi:hypothetical protein